jgi:lipase
VDGAVTAREARLVDVPVAGGALRVGVWEADAADAPTALLVHGITSSHLAWAALAERLPDVRLIAPDLRGRGGSRDLPGPAGLAAHADDLADVLDHLGVARALVVGHSMGGFVSVVFADRHPARVTRVLLVDGGLPLDVPPGMGTDEVIAGVLGPTAARLSLRFADVDEYLAFWHRHPAFQEDWAPGLPAYFAYDLVDDGDGALRPATAYETVVEDVTDMNAHTLPDALGRLRHPTRLLTVARGLQDEEPGMYAPAHLERLLAATPSIAHERVAGYNHYSIVLSDSGADVLAEAVRDELAAG